MIVFILGGMVGAVVSAAVIALCMVAKDKEDENDI